MALLFPREEVYEENFAGSDAATRALSVMSIETSFVEGVYEKMASVYDLFFGLPLHHGRATAISMARMPPREVPTKTAGRASSAVIAASTSASST